MAVGTLAKRPVIHAFVLADRQVVDAGDTQPHQPVVVELPVFVAVSAEPVAAVVMPRLGKAHRDAIFPEDPDLLDESVVEFFVPFANQPRGLESSRLGYAMTVDRIGDRHLRGIARIPGIFGGPDFLPRALSGVRGT